MKNVHKATRVWAYVAQEEMRQAVELCETTGLQQAMLFSLLISAGLEAVVEAGYRLPLPLKLTVVEPPSARAAKGGKLKPLAPQ